MNPLRCLTVLFLSCLPLFAAPAPRPNLVFIMADDVGWGDFQCYNPRGKVPTPNIDWLAREGMRFTDAHMPAALTEPTGAVRCSRAEHVKTGARSRTPVR